MSRNRWRVAYRDPRWYVVRFHPSGTSVTYADFPDEAEATETAARLNGESELSASAGHLRRLGVFVDEPDPGHFYWVVHESSEDASVWVEIEASEEAYLTWATAWEHGAVALHRLIADPAIGPRAPGEDEDAAPVG